MGQRLVLRNKENIWNQLLLMYGEKCVYCHNQIATQIDHVIPYSYIPCHDLINLRPSCARCNLIASDKVFEDFEEKYKYVRTKNFKSTLLRCIVCTIPFYSELHTNQFYCPHCVLCEYPNNRINQESWNKWLIILKTAGMFPQAYEEVSDMVFREGLKIELRTKFSIVNNRILQLIEEEYQSKRRK